jgi:short-subunit dehydrogenase
MESTFKNKVVIITGGSMGIGKELAKQVLHMGGKVIITGRNNDRLRKVENEFSGFKDQLATHTGDVTDYNNNLRLVETALNHFGKIDMLIANAGLSSVGEFISTDPMVLKSVIDTNIYGCINPIKACLHELKKTKGAVMLISSVAGLQGLPGYSAYCLSKMSLKAIAQCLQAELKEEGVFCGISYVGFTTNEVTKITFSANGEEIPVPQRPKIFTRSREKTALKILLQIKRRKLLNVQTVTGKMVYWLSRFFPRLLNFIIRKIYKPESADYEIKKTNTPYNALKP